MEKLILASARRIFDVTIFVERDDSIQGRPAGKLTIMVIFSMLTTFPKGWTAEADVTVICNSVCG
jgi:hypothetical protein